MSAGNEPRPSRLSGFECPACEALHEGPETGACPSCAGPLLCRYSTDGLESAAGPGDGLARWSALLPVQEPARLSGSGRDDLQVLPLRGLAEDAGFDELTLLRGGSHPSGAISARGFEVAAAAWAERGAESLSLASAGPSAAACAAAAKRQGLSCRVAIPSGATPVYRLEARLMKARVVAVLGDRGVAGDWMADHPGGETDRVVSAFAEPTRLEGAKTLAFEIAERLPALPEAIVVPTGSGLGLVALAKGFDELEAAGLLGAPKPKLVAAQVEACAPLARAFAEGAEDVTRQAETHRSLAESLRDPAPAGGRLALQAIRASGGTATIVTEGLLVDALRRAGRLDAVLPGPEGAVALAAAFAARESGSLGAGRVLCLDPNALWRCPEALEAAGTG